MMGRSRLAIAVCCGAWSLSIHCAAAQTANISAETAAADTALEEVTVTARRAKESAIDVPQSITAFSERTLENLNIQSFSDYATKVPNLSFSYGNGQLGFGTSRTVAIRGISGNGTTGVYIDDTPIPESVDPRVVDIQRIEVLKGPQGTLYGEGSLGGNVKMVTNGPSLTGNEFRIESQAGGTSGGGSADYGGTGIANLVLAQDTLALRIVGFGSHDSGYITRTFPSSTDPSVTSSVNNQGAVESYGGSMTLLFKLNDSFQAIARLLAQHTENVGLPTAYAPLPTFLPESYTLNRAANVQEYASDGWYLPSLELVGKLPGVTITSSTSYFSRKEHEIEDGTEGTASILELYGVPDSLAANGYAWPTYTRQNRLNEELRAAITGNQWFNAVVGAFYEENNSQFGYPPFVIPGLAATGLYPTDLGWSSAYPAYSRDTSAFGEAYFRAMGFELTVGLRKFWLTQTGGSIADGILDGGLSESLGLHSTDTGINPKAALSYKFSQEGLVYVSASKGFRAGGPNAALPSVCDDGLAEIGVSRGDLTSAHPDTVWNYEVGAKEKVGGLLISGAAFEMRWNHIQQTLTVPVCYVSLTTNAGAARVRGAELEAVGQLLPNLDFRFGLGYEDGRITEQGVSGQAVGSPIYAIPEFTGVVSSTYTHTLGSTLEGFVSVDYSYTGQSLSGVTRYYGGSPVRPAYDLVNGRIGVRHDQLEISLYGKNLTNARPNLGDINPASYVRVDNAGTPIPRVAVERPLQLGLQVRYTFK